MFYNEALYFKESWKNQAKSHTVVSIGLFLSGREMDAEPLKPLLWINMHARVLIWYGDLTENWMVNFAGKREDKTSDFCESFI